MVKIGAELPKLSQKINLGIRFLDHPVCSYVIRRIKDSGSGPRAAARWWPLLLPQYCCLQFSILYADVKVQ